MSQPAPGPPASDYWLAPVLVVRFAAAAVVLLAAVLVVLTLLVAVLDLPAAVLVVVAGVGVLGALLAAYLLRRTVVVHLGEDGFRVRLLRGVGVARASWPEVREAATATPAGTPVVILKLDGDRTTTIAVQALDADREEFVRDLQAHLQHGHGLRSL